MLIVVSLHYKDVVDKLCFCLFTIKFVELLTKTRITK